ncbi:MAG: hypothetical protein M3512_10875 [Bacteroidota bacterium]|nr:hypothetical protein [Bacteroidota bacterium]
MKKFLLLIMAGLCLSHAKAQTLNDGLMMPKRNLCTGFIFTQDKWGNYWEGAKLRDNQNIGKVTNSSIMWMGAYGITDKLNAIAVVPYITTKSSLGTMQGMEGIQDLTLALKYNFLDYETGHIKFKTFAVGSFSTPLAPYTIDYLPLSIGMGSTNLGGRLTTFAHIKKTWFVNASGGYTWRSNVSIDRTSYFTEGKLYLSNEVKMPPVFDYFISAGYLKNGLQAELFFVQQNTLGGGDIRRQDMPFVSNKMNFSRSGVLVMYYIPQVKGLAVRGSASYTLAGRNFGQSAFFLGGLLYTIKFSPKSKSINP